MALYFRCVRNIHLPTRNLFAKNAALSPSARLLSTSDIQKEYAFEMACSNIRYGEGVTQEIGMDCKNLKAKHVCVMTDKNVVKLEGVKVAIESLERENIPYKLYYEKVTVEPTDVSFKEAIKFAKEGNFDVFVAIGGGSVMDTCKAANLYSSNPEADFLDYVNAPIGKGLPVTHQVKPLIAVTTTAGTGSETTGTAVFDLAEMGAKTGISNRALRPTLGIVDPKNLTTMPERVAAYSGIDVLCHALESYTNLPYRDRPRPENPNLRPAYQGSNPISDMWSLYALEITSKYIKRAVFNPDDMEARSQMHLASCYAGIGFGNAGVHLCHGMSYPVSGLVKSFTSKDYDPNKPLIPHGLSVIVSAPAVFKFTAPACPERHLRAAESLGVDIRNKRIDDAGNVLADKICSIMSELNMPAGLEEMGYSKDDIPALVKGTLPQHRVLKLSPRPYTEEVLADLFDSSMKVL